MKKIQPKEEPEEVEKDDLYDGFPLDASLAIQQKDDPPSSKIKFGNVTVKRESSPPPPPPPQPPRPALKSALSRSEPPESQSEGMSSNVKIEPKEEPQEEEQKDDLYNGLPPAASSASASIQKGEPPSSKIRFGNVTVKRESSPSPPPQPSHPALKSALKRSKPPDSHPEGY